MAGTAWGAGADGLVKRRLIHEGRARLAWGAVDADVELRRSSVEGAAMKVKRKKADMRATPPMRAPPVLPSEA
jgi:hypothetical protein